MRKRFEESLLHLANCLELFISVLMIIMLIILSLKFFVTIIDARSYVNGQDNLTTYLTMALNLAVGVEFVKMLCKHTPETIIEVLLFATARQMIVYHQSAYETLVGVAAIAGPSRRRPAIATFGVLHEDAHATLVVDHLDSMHVATVVLHAFRGQHLTAGVAFDPPYRI